MTWRGGTTPQDRFLACLPYLLVLLSGYSFKTALFRLIPGLWTILGVIISPVDNLYRFVAQIFYPIGSLVIFFGLLILVVRNPKVHYFIRFNTIQALLLTILLTLFSLVLSLIPKVGIITFGILAIETLIFIGVLVTVVYVILQCSRGLYAELPKISEAARAQVR